MSDTRSTGNSTDKRMRPLWRWLLVLFALAILGTGIVNYQIASSINWYYFKSRAVPLTVADYAWGVLALYLFAVAIFGRWLPARRPS